MVCEVAYRSYKLMHLVYIQIGLKPEQLTAMGYSS